MPATTPLGSTKSLLRQAGRRLPGPLREAVWSHTTGRRAALRWGSLRRTTPLSTVWGADRGLPVDRRYIEDFLAAHEGDVRGDVLEVEDAGYTERFGGGRVTAVHVLDLDAGNAQATIVGDLAAEETLSEGRFDCFILTQTIQFIRDADAATTNAYRCLRPGGVLLLTVPTTSRLEIGREDYWRWTPDGLEELLGRSLPLQAERTVTGYGNVLTSAAFLYGVGADELTAEEYAVRDPYFPMLACARIRKPA